MDFSSGVFCFLFLPVLLLCYFNPLLKKRHYKNIILVIFSIIFYAWGEPLYVLLLLLNIYVNYIMALRIEKTEEKSKQYLIIGIVYNLFILFLFKYLNFFIETLNGIPRINLRSLNLSLPIGISFYTFQSISYLCDVYHKPGGVQRGIWNVALYISLFPQLIAGPIVRYETIEQEISERRESWNDISKGITRFIIGLSKKILLANTFGIFVDTFWGSSSLSSGMAWLVAISYTLQIYFDFCGYSDMAIGLGGIFGFHFQENFKYPYCACSITDFWRRWHISLSSWFRDYVYIPLGGNRVGRWRNVLNLFIVWLLTGIWHGANWTFVIWGMMYFVLLTVEKLVLKGKNAGWIGHVCTMFCVIIAWVVFRAENIVDAVRFLKTMFLGAHEFFDNQFWMYLNSYKWYFILGILASLPIKDRVLNNKVLSANRVTRLGSNVVYIAGMFLLMIASISAIVKGSYNPFIYFNF